MRLNRSLEKLGSIGESPEGMQRIAFSPADIQGREYTISLMRRAGMETRIDPAGNIIGRRAGSVPGLPAIAMGSHTDTVPNGGKYDGALGVMGAVECVQTLADNNLILRHPVEALVFTNAIGQLAEAEGHHPKLTTEWGSVGVTWWTHKIRNLHTNDFVMAAKTDRIYGELTPTKAESETESKATS